MRGLSWILALLLYHIQPDYFFIVFRQCGVSNESTLMILVIEPTQTAAFRSAQSSAMIDPQPKWLTCLGDELLTGLVS